MRTLKYEVPIFTIPYLKHVTKEKRQQRRNLENQLKKLKESLDEDAIVAVVALRMN